MSVIKITIYDDNYAVERIDYILSIAGIKHFVKHGEEHDSKFDIIVFENSQMTKQKIINEFPEFDYEEIEMNIEECDLDSFPLPHLIPDNPDSPSIAGDIIAGLLIMFVITGIIFLLI